MKFIILIVVLAVGCSDGKENIKVDRELYAVEELPNNACFNSSKQNLRTGFTKKISVNGLNMSMEIFSVHQPVIDRFKEFFRHNNIKVQQRGECNNQLRYRVFVDQAIYLVDYDELNDTVVKVIQKKAKSLNEILAY